MKDINDRSFLERESKEPISFKIYPHTKKLLEIISKVTGKSKTLIFEESLWLGFDNQLTCSKQEYEEAKKLLKKYVDSIN